MSDYEGSPNQQLDDGESADFPSLKCPLEPSTFLKSFRSTGLQAALKEIEEHVSSSNQCYHPPQKDLILHGLLDGTTPLLLACCYGDIDCVKHLIEIWRVDFQASGVYYHSFPSNFWRIESATPLFVASHNGHLNIVKYLVGLGADVSSKTSSEKTPLHGAVQQSHHPESLAIVHFLLESGADPSTLTSNGRPIWMDSSCGVNATTALIQHGLNLNQRNWSNETILHHWAHHPLFGDTTSNRAALAVVELLVNSGADLMARDNSGFTPLLRAASHSRYEVVDFLATRDYTGETGRMEMIDGLEMAAAKILWESSNGLNSGQERAFEYLRQALDLRQIDALHMTPLKLKRGRTIGWTTAAQLDRVMEQPVEYILQSYLIQLRICSGRSWQAVSSLRDFLYDCIDRLKQQNRLDDLIDILWATLEKIQLHYLDSHYNHQLYIVDDVVQDLIWTLSQLERTDPLNNAETFKTILKVLLLKHARFDELFCRHRHSLLKVVTFLAGLSSVTLNETSKIPIASGEKALEQEESKSVMELLRQLVDVDNHDWCRTVLHLASETENWNSATVQLLLEANSNPNALDLHNGNGPLHVLAARNHGNGVVIESVARLLLKYGAHLDMVNKDRKTAAQIWKEKNEFQDLPLWLREPGTVPKLLCLSARIIRSNNIAVTKENCPETLHPFIKWH